MGTNFYWRAALPAVHPAAPPGAHLGKRSAAGDYCWTCDATLCRRGKAGVHLSDAEAWASACPTCGATVPPGILRRSAAVELGFVPAAALTRPEGVTSVASFTWAVDPELVGTICRQQPDRWLIEDEYGRTYAGQGFLDLLAHTCPIQYTHAIGQEFC